MTRRLAITIGIDILLLLELGFVMFICHGKGEEMVTLFLATFLPLSILTLLVGRWLKRRCGDQP